MRVLHIHTGGLYGGVETMLTCLERHVDAMPGCRMTFALMAEGKLARDLRGSGGKVVMLPPARLRSPLETLRARRALGELLVREKFDLVVSHSTWTQAIFGSTVRRAGVPLLFWQHNAFEDRHWIERLAAAAPPDLVISNSQYSAGTLSRVFRGVPHEVVYYPVERPQQEPSETGQRVRDELYTSPDDVVIIQVSRMEEWKGQLLLAEALGELANVPGWTCWQVGGAQRNSERQYENRLRERVASLGIENRVRFAGHRHDVARLLASADLHCQPNLRPESFGITFVEALYRGLPVVTTRMGGPLEIVDSSCGVLIEHPDAAELSAVLRRLIERSEVRESLAANGPARAALLCDPVAQASRVHEVFSRMT
ncbi:MAG TPA: glycosyltransferase family 4 protein [Thermoanaerobaculia bacterium]|nr:glycosyltransferase family 4 protein [Thermoanaerobaculia bacterium]